jgi:hypothetical protein
MEVIPVTKRNRLTPDQKEVWDVIQPHLAEASEGSTQQQAVNLGVLSLLWWCEFDGMQCTEEAIRAEFEAAGAPELCPPDDVWEFLRDNPGYPWILAPRGTDAWRS